MRVLCANGWAQPPNGLASLGGDDALHLDYAPCDSFDATSALIARQAPDVDLAIGWSLGAAILLDALQRGRLRVPKLVLIAPALHFVATPDVPWAMDPLTYRLFCDSYAKDPVRTAKRFHSLIAKGDAEAPRILRDVPTYERANDNGLWGKWLGLLGERSFINIKITDKIKLFIVHGTNDIIVKIKQSEFWAEDQPQAELMKIFECGHAPHWHDQALVRQRIRQFVG